MALLPAPGSATVGQCGGHYALVCVEHINTVGSISFPSACAISGVCRVAPADSVVSFVMSLPIVTSPVSLVCAISENPDRYIDSSFRLPTPVASQNTSPGNRHLLPLSLS
ncbi:hypothetical protein RRG08_053673 [Elysia crispata]|uniref:Uncharacterized protein n=1 Tax=Elysia crispata TaxID=231223 RepID=A0AAE0ZPP8_9GAST|nr:hypothetical protein RRG08_053673 [Elysia crispata]